LPRYLPPLRRREAPLPLTSPGGPPSKVAHRSRRLGFTAQGTGVEGNRRLSVPSSSMAPLFRFPPALSLRAADRGMRRN
jgi:hypothetical protein